MILLDKSIYFLSKYLVLYLVEKRVGDRESKDFCDHRWPHEIYWRKYKGIFFRFNAL
jgi:hypothetical protein